MRTITPVNFRATGPPDVLGARPSSDGRNFRRPETTGAARWRRRCAGPRRAPPRRERDFRHRRRAGSARGHYKLRTGPRRELDSTPSVKPKECNLRCFRARDNCVHCGKKRFPSKMKPPLEEKRLQKAESASPGPTQFSQPHSLRPTPSVALFQGFCSAWCAASSCHQADWAGRSWNLSSESQR